MRRPVRASRDPLRPCSLLRFGQTTILLTLGEAMTTNLPFLTPVLVLIAWTLVLWVWMYATRLPAMRAARVDPQDAAHHGTWEDRIPSRVRGVADNYNHLHEQPTIFYALMFFAVLTGGADSLSLSLAWAYVALRVVHSLIQATVNRVVWRFSVFSLGSIVLMILTIRQLLRLAAG